MNQRKVGEEAYWETIEKALEEFKKYSYEQDKDGLVVKNLERYSKIIEEVKQLDAIVDRSLLALVFTSFLLAPDVIEHITEYITQCLRARGVLIDANEQSGAIKEDGSFMTVDELLGG